MICGLTPVLLSGDRRKLARHLDVGAALDERYGHVIGAALHRGVDVAHVLAGQCRRRQAAAQFVDPLVVRQVAADPHRGVNLAARHALDIEHDQTVIQQQCVTRLHLPRQVLVIEPDPVVIAERGARIEHEFLAPAQRSPPAFELPDADFRPLQVGHDRNVAAELGRGFTNQLRARQMVVRRPMRKIEAHDVYARNQHALEHQRLA